MTIFFRVDCGAQYGLGHAVRCRTLAQAIRAQDPDVPLVFLTTTDRLRSVIDENEQQWRVVVCSDEWQAYEAVAPLASPGDVVVFDEPVGHSWVETLWRMKIPQEIAIVRIDAPWAASDSCDLLILPGMHHSAETIDRLDAAFGERLLVGAEYVMLREGVVAERPRWHEHCGGIVFATGGSDPGQVMPMFYTMVRGLRQRLPLVQRIFAMGQSAEAWSLSSPVRAEWITGFHPSYVLRAELFVTLWGTTVYEALALGTPTLMIARTEAEAEDAARLEIATDGAVQSLGTLVGLMRETLCDRLVTLWQDTKERKRMHYASAGLLDGKGAERVAQAVMSVRKHA